MKKYNYYDDGKEHPRYPFSVWQGKVNAGDTVEGYNDWVEEQLESEPHFLLPPDLLDALLLVLGRGTPSNQHQERAWEIDIRNVTNRLKALDKECD